MGSGTDHTKHTHKLTFNQTWAPARSIVVVHVPLLVLVLVLLMVGPAIISAQTPAASPGQRGGSGAASPPGWYFDPPSLPDTMIARGRGRSHDEHIAIDKALAEARSVLARTIDRRWKRLLKAIEAEGGERRRGGAEPVILTGSTPLMQTVGKRAAMWTAYVLVGLPESSVHAFLLRRLLADRAWYDAVRANAAVRAFEDGRAPR